MSRSRMFGDESPPGEVPSPRTTIVGGRPPEAGAELPPVPTGIQQLLRLASVDPGFRQKLIEGRGAVAEAAGVRLTPNERAVLQAAPAAQVEVMIDNLPPAPPDRRGFLRGVAASAVTALGGAALATVGGACPVRGARPDPPPARPEHTGVHPTAGAAPDEPPPRPEHRETETEGGAAPDEPPERVDVRLQAPGGAAPDVPSPTRGIRPDVPPKKKKKKTAPAKPEEK